MTSTGVLRGRWELTFSALQDVLRPRHFLCLGLQRSPRRAQEISEDESDISDLEDVKILKVGRSVILRNTHSLTLLSYVLVVFWQVPWKDCDWQQTSLNSLGSKWCNQSKAISRHVRPAMRRTGQGMAGRPTPCRRAAGTCGACGTQSRLACWKMA